MADHVVADIEIGRSVRGELTINLSRRSISPARRVFLMHGFNVGDKGMRRDYRAFLKSLARIAPELEAEVETVQWPGEFTYWKAVDLARGEYAQMFAGFVAEVAAQHAGELVFIGHSLGCRLIIETLMALSPSVQAQVLPRTRLFLMAAAVPTELFNDVSYDQLARQCRQVDILYSGADQVLRTLFPPGQFPELRRWATAVGLTGDPSALWAPFRHRMRGHGHARYWKDPAAANALAYSLSAVTARLAPSSQADTRDTLSRSPAGRTLPRRDLPTRRHRR